LTLFVPSSTNLNITSDNNKVRLMVFGFLIGLQLNVLSDRKCGQIAGVAAIIAQLYSTYAGHKNSPYLIVGKPGKRIAFRTTELYQLFGYRAILWLSFRTIPKSYLALNS
jgi:hypothetical protein